MSKGRDDLAREALVEKRRFREKAEALQRELREHHGLVDQYQEEIVQLEDKLAAAREKQRTLIQRHIHAQRKRQAEEEIRRASQSEAIHRFERYENRIERMEAEADLVNFGRRSTLEEDIASLEEDEELQKELEALKASAAKEETKEG